jgi:uroporphyrinogen-III decarboxylase
MDSGKKWAELSWQEKREERFKRWLSPPDAKFINPEAERLYKARVTRFIKAIKLEEPDRVPVILPTGNFPAYHAGVDLRTVMYDYNELRRAWIKFMDDFGDMDSFSGAFTSAGRISEALDLKINVWPGHGLPADASMIQIVEGEYMKADEYDQYLLDTSDYQQRVNLPKSAGLFESFKKLPSIRSLQGQAWVTAMADPDIRKTFQTLMDLADEHKKHSAAIKDVSDTALSRGYPSVRGRGPMLGAPFDNFADLLRGTRGISMDMNRQPQKLHQAMEHQTLLGIKSVKGFPMTNCPIIMMPLHKGDDTFMSDKQFEIFYWPYLKRIFMALIEEGLVPMPFAEGKYTRRLKQITDMPRTSVVWYFDQTDMAEAKKILGNVSCIAGNVPTSVVMTGSTDTVKDYCRKLIQNCAAGGGYILAGGASIDKGNMPNLKAMMESAYEYGVYKK